MRISELSQNLQDLNQRIQKACAQAKRNPDEITLIWVSKTKPLSDILAAKEAGAIHFGENRIQEALEKFTHPINDTELHIIGPIQSNKWRKAVQVAQWIHSVDRLDQIQRLNELAAEAQKTVQVLLQVNTSLEDSKSGIPMDQAREFLSNLPTCPNLKYRGLMTIGPNSGDPEDAREGFQFLKSLQTEFHGSRPDLSEFTELSMGMSEDLEIAIAEGATLIRVGSALFGSRG